MLLSNHIENIINEYKKIETGFKNSMQTQKKKNYFTILAKSNK